MKKRNAKKRKIPKVKKVVLPPTAVLEVVVPKGTAPVVITDPDKGIVKIIPAPVAKVREPKWYEGWFR